MVFEKIFILTAGDPFSASNDAELWLKKNGYSFGSRCMGGPQAIMKGDVLIAKWRNLTAREKGMCDGTLHSRRDAASTVIIRHNQPDGAS